MNKIFNLILFCSLFFQSSILICQNKYDFNEDGVISRLKNDITILASDSFMGREAGTDGEKLASEYLKSELIKIGLTPYFGDTSFFQSFTSSYFVRAGRGNYLNLNGKYVAHNNAKICFYPLAYSSSGELDGELLDAGFGINSPELSHNDYAGIEIFENKIFVIETSIPNGYSKTSKFEPYRYLRRKIDTAIVHGAKGIIFINSEKSYPNPTDELNLSVVRREIPILFYTGRKENLIKDDVSVIDAFIVITPYQGINGKNVAGYLNNHAEKTVIIGGHYDHLGTFESDNDEDNIFNGADDNASGTAGVLELARYIKSNKLAHYNYVFVLFSAEEKGLLGSKHFVNFNSTGIENIAYMLNLDMIGRSGSKSKNLIVYGVATSKSWKRLLKNNNSYFEKTNYIGGSSGGSDHHPFYKAGIPVLFFFTGIHNDYHKVTDEEDLINYKDAVKILYFAENIIGKLELKEIPKFNKVSGFRNALTYLSLF